MPKSDPKKLHELADTLISSIEEKVMLEVLRGGLPHEGTVLQFTSLQPLPDSFVAKGEPFGMQFLTETLREFDISHIPEDLLLGRKRVTIPFIDDRLEEKLENAVRHMELTLNPPPLADGAAEIHGASSGRER